MEKCEHPKTIAIIGLGEIGYNLVRLFCPIYNIIGFDISSARVAQLTANLQNSSGNSKRQHFTCLADQLRHAQIFLIATPTLMDTLNTVDLSHIQAAVQIVDEFAPPRSIIVIESSVAVGTTRKLLGPVAARKHHYAGMSPEVQSARFVELYCGMD
jgi:UDP-N-acetyl-D-mannosaminuronate dehydrogenase